MRSPEILRSLSGILTKVFPKELQTTLSDFRWKLLIAASELLLNSYIAKSDRKMVSEVLQNSEKKEEMEEHEGDVLKVRDYYRKKAEEEANYNFEQESRFLQFPPRQLTSDAEIVKMNNCMATLLERGREVGVWRYLIREISENTYKKSEDGYHAVLPSGVRIIFDRTFNTYICPDPSGYTSGEMSDQFIHDYHFLVQ